MVSQRVTQMLNLRNIVKNVPLLRDAVQGSQARLLNVVCEVSEVQLRIRIFD